ncbi:trimeric intracellular cation channel family protein [Pseudosulfitobacter pseudonitzschiae]|uniref:Membrane protein n=1 Tax=Pseudosulfitobacter pseudonitzschiae TaxID=1402135 RepID=A0A073J070_9RHOB|nr:trimeric intracellular cation channel family protein [Pseudosulfitobacter pseudonitzschiae]KEJ95101.1 membrane protein [Pseudosulfitobacter pseudonitzschiae]MBM1816597.1 trimeric intracellular cation channel family protein [Pseudosulfitobacter pseudonitzschiae]MBM1833195.1 trimeric intracellular cation channel family protein [Pseudosulfitobacter pseudonitzschiae]MBM1838063.1 trimeric intracellular cation channel family protein [Pseudosulfitobacter pseudonitzschiae]MBM1843324.1 trimeric intr
MSWLALLDFGSVMIFALTGALVASRAQMDPVGFLFIACLTAMGGGTLRDVLLDRNPVFWIAQPTYIAVACGAAIVVFFTAHLLESRLRTLVWLDSLALAIAVPAGAGVALDLGAPAPIIILMGMITGCMGGLMRDVVVGDVPVVLKQGELYVSAAFGGALALWLTSTYIATGLPALVAGAGVTWALRAGSLAFGWQLPTYRSTPPKS